MSKTLGLFEGKQQQWLFPTPMSQRNIYIYIYTSIDVRDYITSSYDSNWCMHDSNKDDLPRKQPLLRQFLFMPYVEEHIRL